jgi:hypothetical protein
MDDARPPLNKASIAAFCVAVLGACAVIGIAFGALPIVAIDQSILAVILILSSILALILGIVGFIQAHRRGQSGFLFALIAVLYGVAGITLTILVLFFLSDIKKIF